MSDKSSNMYVKQAGFDYKKRKLKKYLFMLEKLKRLHHRREAMEALREQAENGNGLWTASEQAAMDTTLDRIDELTLRALEVRRLVYRVIDTNDDYIESEILERFFIEGQRLPVIAEEMAYSERHVTRLYTKAVNGIDVDKLNDVIEW